MYRVGTFKEELKLRGVAVWWVVWGTSSCASNTDWTLTAVSSLSPFFVYISKDRVKKSLLRSPLSLGLVTKRS